MSDILFGPTAFTASGVFTLPDPEGRRLWDMLTETFWIDIEGFRWADGAWLAEARDGECES